MEEWVGIAIAGFSAVSCVGIVSLAWYQAQIRAAIIQQQGIDRRAAARGNDPALTGERVPWYGAVITAVLPELLKSPAVQKMISDNAPALLAKLSGVKKE